MRGVWAVCESLVELTENAGAFSTRPKQEPALVALGGSPSAPAVPSSTPPAVLVFDRVG